MAPNFLTLSATDLLAIPANEPERLYSGEIAAARLEYRKLALLWHPDRCRDPRANEVFSRIKQLHDAAIRKLVAGAWVVPGRLVLNAANGARYEMRYARKHALEIGEMYVGKTAVVFVIAKANADLVSGAERLVAAFPFKDDPMRDEIARCLPPTPLTPLTSRFETIDAHVWVMQKSPDVLLLRDVLAHFGGRMDARHVAWIISSALNLACYFQYAGLVHNAISADTYFISPAHHSGVLLGGWWYAASQGTRMIAAPARTVDYAPHDLLTTKKADIRTDLELIRALGRELLGDVRGTRLAREKAALDAMLRWLRLPASGDAVTDYREWQDKVLKDSFGARRFVELSLTHSDIYS